MSGPPLPATIIEARHGSAGARRAEGVWGPCRGPHYLRRSSRPATAPPGRAEQRGVWGPCRGSPLPATIIEARHGSAGARRAEGVGGHVGAPITCDDHRGPPRLRRGAPSRGGFGGHVGAPITCDDHRGAPRLRRSAPSLGGGGGHGGAPVPCEARRGPRRAGRGG